MSHNPASASRPTPASTPDAAAKDPTGKEKSRYKDTLNLPSTTFPMKANLVQNEPASIKRWNSLAGTGLYKQLRESRAGRERYIFHDGPPYANGSIHLGHLMNKVLKDLVVRSKGMQGLDVPYTPGWDCHGLPIEHKVMQEMQEKGKAAKLATLGEDQRKIVVRRECQAYAEKYVKLHKDQMTRLLTLADYADPYLTMSPAYEGATLEVLATLLERGIVYRQLKPVHWSPANETALADAELEYEDREDPSIYVDFEAADADAVYDAFGLLRQSLDEEEIDEQDSASENDASRAPKPGARPLQRPCFMIWTTTPWTLPANLAIAVNPKFEYALVWIDGNVTVLASDAVERVTKRAGSENVVVIARTRGEKLLGLRYRHPFVESTPTFPKEAGGDAANCYKVVGAEYVTLEDGTGLVHTAPGHGTEDYQTGLREKIPVYCPVRENGSYDDSVPSWLRGVNIWEANTLVVKHLRNSGHMFFDHVFTHSYPHDWRSKTPVIFRCTEQWFVGFGAPPLKDRNETLKHLALSAVEEDRATSTRRVPGITFVPEWGRNRLRGMLESRPDWCISRQRAWGLPIPAFFLPSGEVLMTPASVRAVSRVFREHGSDAWFTKDAGELLKYYDPAKDESLTTSLRLSVSASLAALRKGNDILDVWFESGSSWYACMKERGQAFTRPDRSDAIDLYLEGSDQHRGWFQLSLLPALGVMGRPPFKTLLTHGFMVDRDGRKLSKSRPDAHRYEVDSLCSEFGMDVMRWWVSSLAYENDVKVDVELFALAGESYRKVRNTLRFMLSNLADYTPASGNDSAALSALPPTALDAWVLAEFDALRDRVIDSYNSFDYQSAHKALFDFCNSTLSATYLAAIKDRLYCDRPDAPRRRRAQGVLWSLTDGLCRLLAPILCHTADEAYRALLKCDADDSKTCVHLRVFPERCNARPTPAWKAAHEAVRAAQVELEKAKSRGIENPLDAGVVLPLTDALREFDSPDGRVELADLLGVSIVIFDASIKSLVIRDLRDQPRCERSWKRDGTVKRRSDGGMLSDRDAAAVGVE